MYHFFIVPLLFVLLNLPFLAYADEIHKAVRDGNLEKVKGLLINDSTLVNIKDEKGYTPLHIASELNNLEIAKILIGYHADVNAVMNDLNIPLQLTVFHNQKEMAQLLVDSGSDINSQNIGSYSTLHCAVMRNNLNVVKVLVENGADIEIKSRSQVTPLHFAAFRSDPEIVEYLISKGADVNTRDEQLYSPLMHAAAFKKYENAKLLIENGAKLDLFTNYGASALHRASQVGALDVIELLLENDADINIVNEANITPLMQAVMIKCKESTELLLKHGAKIEIKDNHYGRTALHKASILGYGDIVQLLINAGADVNVLDNDKKTPLYYANKYDHKNVQKLLQEKEAYTEKSDDNSNALYWLNKKLIQKEAIIWYLGRSGWAIKTTSHLLIFDYSKNNWGPDVPSLSNGYIPAEELVGQNVFVFVTNGRYDRYDTKILEWQKQNKNITYILGFDPNKTRIHRENKYNGPAYEYIGPGQSKNVDSIEIHGTKAIEGGVGYLVKVDGISFFHLGNHVIRKEESFFEFKDEIDNFMQHHNDIDVAFIPIRSFRIQDRKPIEKGFIYTKNKLKPKVIFPMQALELEDLEYVYKEYAKVARENGCITNIICADNSGDRFLINLNK